MGDTLSIEDVWFLYGEMPVLRGVSLRVASGCFLGLVGPNGSGKTTLLRIAAGLLKPARGRVLLGGEPVDGMSRMQLARQLAFLPQGANLPTSFTAWELVLMGRTPYISFLGRESPSDVAAAERAMELAGCRELAGRRIGELSGGEQQRVLMARALAQQPKVLLLDEPTAHMDMQHQIAAVELVASLVEEGMATLGVFHDLNLAARYCHRIALLSRGSLAAEGAPAEVLTQQAISSVFKVKLCLAPHPEGGAPAVLPRGRSRSNGSGRP